MLSTRTTSRRRLMSAHRHNFVSSKIGNAPSRSTSYSCARESRSSPSLPSIVLIGLPFESTKCTLILLISSEINIDRLRNTYPVPGSGRLISPCRAAVVSYALDKNNSREETEKGRRGRAAGRATEGPARAAGRMSEPVRTAWRRSDGRSMFAR